MFSPCLIRFISESFQNHAKIDRIFPFGYSQPEHRHRATKYHPGKKRPLLDWVSDPRPLVYHVSTLSTGLRSHKVTRLDTCLPVITLLLFSISSWYSLFFFITLVILSSIAQIVTECCLICSLKPLTSLSNFLSFSINSVCNLVVSSILADSKRVISSRN